MANFRNVQWELGEIISLNKMVQQVGNTTYVLEDGSDYQILFNSKAGLHDTVQPSVRGVEILLNDTTIVEAGGEDDPNPIKNLINYPITSYPNGLSTLSFDVKTRDSGDTQAILTYRFIKTPAMNYLTIWWTSYSIGFDHGARSVTAIAHTNETRWSTQLFANEST